MAAAIAPRGDYESARLRELARQSEDADQVRRSGGARGRNRPRRPRAPRFGRRNFRRRGHPKQRDSHFRKADCDVDSDCCIHTSLRAAIRAHFPYISVCKNAVF